MSSEDLAVYTAQFCSTTPAQLYRVANPKRNYCRWLNCYCYSLANEPVRDFNSRNKLSGILSHNYTSGQCYFGWTSSSVVHLFFQLLHIGIQMCSFDKRRRIYFKLSVLNMCFVHCCSQRRSAKNNAQDYWTTI